MQVVVFTIDKHQKYYYFYSTIHYIILVKNLIIKVTFRENCIILNTKHIGDLLKNVLVHKKLSQNEFAKSINKTRSYISLIKNKKMGEPRYSTIRTFEKALNIRIQKTEIGWSAFENQPIPKLHLINLNETSNEDNKMHSMGTSPSIFERQSQKLLFHNKQEPIDNTYLTDSKSDTSNLQSVNILLIKAAIDLLQAYVNSIES